MSIQLSQYRNQTFEDLVAQAHSANLDNAGQMTPAELIFELVCSEARVAPSVEIVAGGLLEILSDGFGFLRSPVSRFEAGADDVYISPAQIRRFNLRTGDWIEGLVRAPRDNERYFALLRIQKVNGRSPEKEKKRLLFDSQSLAVESGQNSGLLDVQMGDSVLLELSSRQHPAPTLFSCIKEMDDLVVTLLNYSPADIAVIERSWNKGSKNGSLLSSSKGSESFIHQQILKLSLERVKRLAEQGRDVQWVISTINEIALSSCSVAEQMGRSGAPSLGVESVCAIAAEARNLLSTGSLTIWMLGHRGRSTYQDQLIDHLGFEVSYRGTVSSDGQVSLLSDD